MIERKSTPVYFCMKHLYVEDNGVREVLKVSVQQMQLYQLCITAPNTSAFSRWGYGASYSRLSAQFHSYNTFEKTKQAYRPNTRQNYQFCVSSEISNTAPLPS